ncbi:MAG TPA: hypothetical protein VK699_19250 [Terriglobales bacterium]|jgi:hypothetical protein|nr:hypothetical protein [Terriglobales bacterium]
MFTLFSKRTLWLIPILAASLFTTACGDLLSVAPLATDSNTTFDPALIGTWSDLDGSNSVLISVREGDKHNYDILWIDTKNNDKYRVDARLVQIGGQKILDVTPVSSDAGPFTIPGHAFVYISNLENGLKIQFLDSKWVQEKVKQSKSLTYYQLEDHPIITGTSAQLQDFFLQNGLNEQARGEPMSLRRLK